MKSDKRILLAFILNLTFSIFEFIGGALTNSVAIISDSVHDLGDSLSLGISYFLERKSKKKPDEKYTYGYIRYSVLGSVITTTILITGSIFVIYNAFDRLFHPVDINYDGMVLFAIFGVIVNFLAVYFTRRGNSLNQKSVNLHMLEDVLGWIIVLIGSIIIKFTGITWIDSLLSIIVAIYIFIHSIKNLKSILNIFLEKTPDNIDILKIKNDLLKNTDISDVHHIHIWSMDGYSNYATMHIVTDNDNFKVKKQVREKLKEYKICHVTIEIEKLTEKCESKCCNIEEYNELNHHHHHH